MVITQVRAATWETVAVADLPGPAGTSEAEVKAWLSDLGCDVDAPVMSLVGGLASVVVYDARPIVGATHVVVVRVVASATPIFVTAMAEALAVLARFGPVVSVH